MSRTHEEEVLRELSRAWIEEGFSHAKGARDFSYETHLKRFYLQGTNDLCLHDNNDPLMRIETNAEKYGKIWEELFSN